jgi:hypothetical protein
VGAQFKVVVCSRSLAGTESSNPAGGMSSANIVCCHIEVSATGRSLVQRSRIDSACVIECDKVQQ